MVTLTVTHIATSVRPNPQVKALDDFSGFGASWWLWGSLPSITTSCKQKYCRELSGFPLRCFFSKADAFILFCCLVFCLNIHPKGGFSFNYVLPQVGCCWNQRERQRMTVTANCEFKDSECEGHRHTEPGAALEPWDVLRSC